MSSPLISVVVLAYNQFEQTTGPCLQSLSPWFEDHDIEFIVYDNASPDGSGELTAQWCKPHPALRFVQSPTNLGYAGGMNAAAQLARGEWLFLVNNDTQFPEHTLDALKQVLKSAPPHMAMIGPVTNSAGNGQRLYDPGKSKDEWLDLGAWIHQNPNHLLLPTYKCDFFCIAIRRHVWQQLNGLDSLFGMGYFEDFDFSLRVREAGFEQSITEDVFIYHQGSASFKVSNQYRDLMKKNKTIIQQKHPGMKFEHVRKYNLEALQYKLGSAPLSAEDWGAFKEDPRNHIRWSTLHSDTPRSLLKKWVWRRKVKWIENEFF